MLTRIVQLFLIWLITAGAVAAAPLQIGDIVVVTQVSGRVYKVDPVSGAASLISIGGLLRDPSHVLIDQQGRILNAERSEELAGIVRTDPSNAQQILLASGPLLPRPTALSFLSAEKLVVGNSGVRVSNTLVEVDLQTGMQTLLTTMIGVANIQDVDVDHLGRIVVVDYGRGSSVAGKILRFDPSTSEQSVVAIGGELFKPADLVITDSGDYLVSNALEDSTTQILRIDPKTGAQHIELTLASQGFIALNGPDNIVFAGAPRVSSVWTASLESGQVDLIANFDAVNDKTGVGVYSQIPEPPTILLLGVAMLSLTVQKTSRTRLVCRRTK